MVIKISYFGSKCWYWIWL